MHKVVISDTSCLIVLEKINKLELLQQVYQAVLTTPEIVAEFGSLLPDWIVVVSATNKTLQRQLEEKIDRGEASAITLGLEVPECSVILDDLKARKIAESLKIDFTGTLGILVKAKQVGVLDSVKPILKDLHAVGLRFSLEVELDILKQVNE